MPQCRPPYATDRTQCVPGHWTNLGEIAQQIRAPCFRSIRGRVRQWGAVSGDSLVRAAFSLRNHRRPKQCTTKKSSDSIDLKIGIAF